MRFFGRHSDPHKTYDVTLSNMTNGILDCDVQSGVLTNETLYDKMILIIPQTTQP